VAGTILALVAWLIATFIRAAVNRILAATTLDEGIARSQHAVDEPHRRDVLFWLVILLFLPSSCPRTGCAACSGRSRQC
jgi:hypothetical protein